MAVIRPYLDFKTEGQGKKYVDELAGFDAAPFTFEREEGRQAIDITYLGGADVELTITPLAQKEIFDLIKMYVKLYGQEGTVMYGVEIGDTDYLLGEVDIATAETDLVSLFKFVVIDYGKKATFKRRYDAVTNVLGYFSLDDKPVTPLSPPNIFAPAKPITQFSRWRASSDSIQRELNFNTGGLIAYIAPFPQQVNYGIDNSFAPISDFFPIASITNTMVNDSSNRTQARDQSTLIRATSTLKNVRVKIKNFNLFVGRTGGVVTVSIRVNWGTGYEANQFQSITLYESSATVIDIENGTWDVNIPLLNNTDKLWVHVSLINGIGATTSSAIVNYNSGELEISVTSIAPSSVIKGVKVYDVIRKNAEMSADMPVSAPRWAINGEFQNEYFTTKNLIRNILDRPFNISTKDIAEDYLTFCKGDYQVKQDEVFYGREPDFFRNIECGFFPQIQSKSYRRVISPKHLINQFQLGYTSVQSQKENETANTNDEVHYNLTALLPSKKTEKKIDVKIGVIRSAFSIEQARRDAFRLAFENKENAATQDDDKIYAIDVITFASDNPKRNQKYTAALQHVVSANGLMLTNKGDFSWVLLGIETGDVFSISEGANVGSYTVSTITDQTLTVTGGSPSNVAESNTTFNYRVGLSTQHILRTNEGIPDVENIEQGDVYFNLMYTTKRCLVNYWQRFLATCLLYNRFEDINIIEYNNNPEAYTRLSTETIGITEGARFKPVDPLFSGILHENVMLQMTFAEMKELQSKIENDRGWVGFINSDNEPVMGFIERGSYNITSVDEDGTIMGRLECNIEEMYVPAILRLFNDGEHLYINDEMQTSDLQFNLDEYQNLSIFDANGKSILYPVLWNRVSINGVIPTTKEELVEFLDNI